MKNCRIVDLALLVDVLICLRVLVAMFSMFVCRLAIDLMISISTDFGLVSIVFQLVLVSIVSICSVSILVCLVLVVLHLFGLVP